MNTRSTIKLAIGCVAAGLVALAGTANAQTEPVDLGGPPAMSGQRELDALLGDGPAGERARGQRENSERRAQMRQRALERFDADGDGQLSEDERAEARAFMQERRGQRAEGQRGEGNKGERREKFRQRALERFDADGDGQLNEAERTEARAFMEERRAEGNKGERRAKGKKADRREHLRERAIERFDADGDFQLNEAERAEAREFAQQRREQVRARVLERHDANGDGELSQDERQAVRAEARERRDERRAKLVGAWDADGDGQLSREERQTAREALAPLAERGVLRADADLDGQLSADELAEAAKLIAEGDPRYDLNRDGVVDSDDARALFGEDAR